MLHSMKTNASIISVAGKANLNHDLLVEKCWKNEIFGYALEETNKTVFDYEGNIMITSEYARFTDTAIKKRIEIRTQKIIEAKQHFMQMQK
jgi:D-Tyr-tRNAtyr deacylase